MNGIRPRESFFLSLGLGLFSLTFKNILLPSYVGRAIAHVDPSLIGISVTASRIHADNIWLSSRLRVFDFLWFTIWKTSFHARTS